MTGRWLTVPAGTRQATCKSGVCGMPIYFITLRGRPYPVDCDVEGGRRPSSIPHDPLQQGLFATAETEVSADGRGVSHFDTCADPESFRRAH